MKSIELIRAERERQIAEEGYSQSHDDAHDMQQLSCAAAVYACPIPMRFQIGWLWPFHPSYYKPNTANTVEGRIRELVKAGALIVAEIDRLERTKKIETI